MADDAAWVIGFATAADSAESGTWSDTRVGGLPLWPDKTHPNVSPCPLCNQPRPLLLQAFAPHNAHQERILLVFVCNSAKCCRNPAAWCAYRAYRYNKPKSQDKYNVPKPSIAAVNWDTASEDSASESSEDELADLETLLKLRDVRISKSTAINELHEAKLAKSTRTDATATANGNGVTASTIPHFIAHFVEVDVEPEDQSDADPDVRRLLAKYEEEEAADKETEHQSGAGGATWDGEDDAEETEAVVATDEFRNRIARAPEQILRYCFAGKPQWPRHPAPECSSRCARCGAPNVFELQILGTVLFYLGAEHIISKSQSEEALNFLAAGLYTCERDCQSDMAPSQGTFQYHQLDVVIQVDEW